MSGGNFYFHNNASVPVSSSINMTVNSNDDLVGDFVHTARNIYFDNGNPSSNNPEALYKSPKYHGREVVRLRRVIPVQEQPMAISFLTVPERPPLIDLALDSASLYDRGVRQYAGRIAMGDIQLASHPNMVGLPLFLMVNNNGVLNIRTNKLFLQRTRNVFRHFRTGSCSHPERERYL